MDNNSNFEIYYLFIVRLNDPVTASHTKPGTKGSQLKNTIQILQKHEYQMNLMINYSIYCIKDVLLTLKDGKQYRVNSTPLLKESQQIHTFYRIKIDHFIKKI